MVSCPHCQAPLFGNPSRCYKCGQPVAIDDRTAAEKEQQAESERQRQRAHADRVNNPQLRKRCGRFREALNAGHAAVVGWDGVLREGEPGWDTFVNLSPFTALPCTKCQYVVVRSYSPTLDSSWIVRGDGKATADNWMAFYVCPKCGTEHRRQRVTVSHDLDSAFTKEGDPIGDTFGRQPWWRLW